MDVDGMVSRLSVVSMNAYGHHSCDNCACIRAGRVSSIMPRIDRSDTGFCCADNGVVVVLNVPFVLENI